MGTLYVTEQGSRLEKEYHRLLVTLNGEVIQSVLLRSVSEVVLVGTCGATTQAILAMLDQGVGLTFITRSGRLRGRLRPSVSQNLERRLKQYARQGEAAFCLNTAKNIASGKTRNYRTMARRIFRSLKEKQHPRSIIDLTRKSHTRTLEELQNSFIRIDTLIEQLEDAQEIDVIRGFEGMASKIYFSFFRAGLRWEGERAFEKRQRRPPRDPINAMLGLGYSLLSQSMLTAVEVAGLDPLAGYFHTNQYGRPSLALDLMEEFRPIIVDSIILRMVNQHMIRPVHFYYESDQVLLNKQGLKVFFHQYHRRINTHVFHPQAGRKLTYQKCFEVQAVCMRNAILGDEEHYLPMPWK